MSFNFSRRKSYSLADLKEMFKSNNNNMPNDIRESLYELELSRIIDQPDIPDLKYEYTPDCDFNTTDIAIQSYLKIYSEFPSKFEFSANKDDQSVYKPIELLNYLYSESILIHRTVHPNMFNHVFLFDTKQIVVVRTNLDSNSSYISFFINRKMKPDLDKFKPFIDNDEEAPSIGILKKNSYGEIEVQKINLNIDTKLDIDKHYNDDFNHFHGKFVDKLNNNDSGLYLLHGSPGTGKSEYCKHLISLVKRNFIFISPSMVGYLSTPEFSDILTNTYKGAVLVIEDAEKALMKREAEDGFHNSEIVSSILNLTDGIFSDLSNIAIVATYNCDRNLIDAALLRKGRMRIEYEFHKLSIEKSQNLMGELGISHDVTEPMTLSDVYNYYDQESNNNESKKETRRMGFAE